jgi:hypothetical protein
MIDQLPNLFVKTCASGIQTPSAWWRESFVIGYPEGLPTYPVGSTTVECNSPISAGSYLTGVKIKCNATVSIVIKIAATNNAKNWYFFNVATISHTANTSWVTYFFSPQKAPSEFNSCYIAFYPAPTVNMRWDVTAQSTPVYAFEGNLSGGSFTPQNVYTASRCGIEALVSTVVPVSYQDFKLSLPVTLTSGSYVGLEFQSQSEFICDSVSIQSSPITSGMLKVDYAKFVMDQYYSDGQYNNNTGYATPAMTYHDEPAGYLASASSEISGYWPYEAFTQTNGTTGDCWQSVNTQMSGTAPHSLMFTFSGTGKVINRYQVLSRNDSSIWYRGFPRDWVLQGSNDNRAVAYTDLYWTTLDSRSSVSDPGQNTWTSVFNFENGQSYKRYRLRITARNSESAPTYYHVCVGELKLIEADSVYSSPVFQWYPGDRDVISGTEHTKTFNTTMDKMRLFVGNYGPETITISGISILSSSENNICLGGPSPTLRYTFTDPGPLLLDIKNTGGGSAFPKVSLDYTGNYEVDRNIFLSADYPTVADKDAAIWVGLDSGGILIPERYSWTNGTMSGTTVSRRNLQLNDTSYSGSWISPVVDTEYDPLRLYVYPVGSNYPKIEVRSSDIAPAEAVFLVVVTENTHQHLVYKHKRIVLDSNGNVVSRVECNAPQTGNKIWRMADYTFAGQRLDYYGSVNSLGTASFLAPGYTTCGDIDPAQEALDPTKWYNLCICSLSGTSLWNTGVVASGFEWGPTKSVLYTKTFPLENSEGVFFSAIVTSTTQESDSKVRTRVNMGFYNHDRIMFTCPAITHFGIQLGPDDYYDVIEDYANSGWWAYLGGDIGRVYKMDVGSFNTIRVFGAGNLENDDPSDDDEFYGYLYYLDIENNYKHIVSIPDPNFSGFWAFTSSGICLFKEEYTYETPSLDNVRQISESTITSGGFINLFQGACDSFGNLWLVDQSSERLLRVNLQRTLNVADPNPIDYDNSISGIISVYPHPTNESAYVFRSGSIQNPDQDTIYMVHAGQSPGSYPQFVCAVPGFLSATFKECVSFTGTIFEECYRVSNSDRAWGTDAGGWETVDNKSMLPRGRYAQIRLTLSRPDLNRATPQIQRIRLPQPLALEPIDKLQTRQVAVKTVFNRAKTFGIFNTNLQVWWFDEEFYYG